MNRARRFSPFSIRDARVPTRLQFQTTECGVAALAMLFAHHGRFVTIEELRRATGVSRDCVNAGEMVRAARSYGFICRSYSREPDDLGDLKGPLLVHLRFIHFVVVEGFTATHVLVNDPNAGRCRIPRERFAQDFTGIVMTLEPGPDFKREGRDSHPVGNLWRRLDPGSRMRAGAALGTALGAALTLPAFALLLADWASMIADLSGPLGKGALNIGLLMTLVAVVRGGFLALQNHALTRLREDIAIRQTRKLAQAIERFDADFFTYRLPAKIHAVLYANESAARLLAVEILPAVLAGLGSTVALLGLFWAHAGVAAALTLLIIVGAASVLAVVHFEADSVRTRSSHADDQLGALLFGREDLERAKLGGKDQDFVSQRLGAQARYQQSAQEAGEIESVMNAIIAATSIGGIAATLGPAVLSAAGEGPSWGDTVALVFLAIAAVEPLRRLPGLCLAWDALKLTLLPIDDVLSYPARSGAAARDGDGAAAERPKSPLEDPIVLEARDLSFGYSATRAPMIQDASLTLRRGEQLGITGPSGGGKSTLAMLLSGAREPWSGRIQRAGGLTVACVDKTSFFFEGSLRENLLLWRNDVSEHDLQQALSDACLDDVIATRAGRLDSPVEGQGRNLSGGQRQRLEIARALLTNPEVLILDEATDGLDPALEAQVRANLKHRGCSLVIMSHRASTLAACDRVIRVAGGRIAAAETGGEADPTLDQREEPAGPPVPAGSARGAVADFAALTAAVSHIAGLLGAPSAPPPSPERETSAAIGLHVVSLARLHGLCVRRVRFVVPAWWSLTFGPLLVFRKDSATPLVLTPGARGGRVTDALTGRVEWVRAEDLEPVAYRFHREVEQGPDRTWSSLGRSAAAAWPEFARALVLSIVGAGASLIPAALALTLTSAWTPRTPSVVAFTLGAITLALGVGLIRYVRDVAILRACGRVELAVMAAFTQRLARLDPSLVSHLPAEDLARSLTAAQRFIGRMQGEPVRQVLASLTGLGAIALLATLDLRLAAFATLLAIATVLMSVALTWDGIHSEGAHEREALKSRRFLFDVLRGVFRLRLLGSASTALDRWTNLHDLSQRAGRSIENIPARLAWWHGVNPVLILGLFSIAWSISAPGGAGWRLPAIVLLLGIVAETTSGLGAAMVSFLRCRPLAEQADVIAGAHLEPLAPRDIDRHPPIEVRELSYRYPGTNGRALDRISLQIAPGEFVALTGPSGGGKSTLLRMLVGSDGPEEGAIRLGSREVTPEMRVAWRRQIGLVSQDERVEFSATIRAQVSGAGPFDVASIWEAIRLTLLAEDIAAMPMGLQAIVETGRVSTGQEQRLLMARELIRRPSLLILDEATNAIPDALQARLFANLRQLGLTCLLVTHRESAIALMDRVVVLEAGQLVWSGHPSELSAEARISDQLRAERLDGHH